jgi:S-adenosylmethionine synthetase
MPLPIALAHRLARRLAAVRKDGTLPYLRPDGKTQVTVRYVDGRPVAVEKVLISTQHAEAATAEQLRADLWQHVVTDQLPPELYDASELEAALLVNPTGRFVIGGPHGDTGLTGRKIIVDSYGGWGRHGGGAFSGKDPTKVDRSAAYMARHVAKNVVAAGLADECEVQLAYAIGVADPVSVRVDSFGTGRVDDDRIASLVRDMFPLTPKGIISSLNLRRPIYRKTAAGGHFGRNDPDFTWESIAKAAELRKAAGLGAVAHKPQFVVT